MGPVHRVRRILRPPRQRRSHGNRCTRRIHRVEARIQAQGVARSGPRGRDRVRRRARHRHRLRHRTAALRSLRGTVVVDLSVHLPRNRAARRARVRVRERFSRHRDVVATVIYTHSLDPHVAVVWSGMWNSAQRTSCRRASPARWPRTNPGFSSRRCETSSWRGFSRCPRRSSFPACSSGRLASSADLSRVDRGAARREDNRRR